MAILARRSSVPARVGVDVSQRTRERIRVLQLGLLRHHSTPTGARLTKRIGRLSDQQTQELAAACPKVQWRSGRLFCHPATS